MKSGDTLVKVGAKIFVIVSFLLPFGCSHATSPVDSWLQPQYEKCQLAVTPEGAKLPWDFAATYYKRNLGNTYDLFTSLHAFVAVGQPRKIIDVGALLIDVPNQIRTNFILWTHDGRGIYLLKRWEDPNNGMLEERTKNLHIVQGAYLADIYSYSLETGAFVNLTESPRSSYYNDGVMYWPANPQKLILSTMINMELKPYIMDLDGKNKEPLTKQPGFSYGFVPSADGTRYAFHANYVLYIGNIENNQETKVQTNLPFNFSEFWSPDSQKLAFIAGVDTSHSDLYITDRDGGEVKLLARRNAAIGIPFDESSSFRNGGSDYAVWTPDSRYVIYGAQDPKSDSRELYKIGVANGHVVQLTHSSKPGTMNYFPEISPDGQWLAFVSSGNGNRDLLAMSLKYPERPAFSVLAMTPGCGILWPHFRPKAPHGS